MSARQSTDAWDAKATEDADKPPEEAPEAEGDKPYPPEDAHKEAPYGHRHIISDVNGQATWNGRASMSMR